jgi:predicted ABC-type ATPase
VSGTPADTAYAAMQVAEAIRDDLVERGESFCMETVLSDTVGANLSFLRHAQQLGYRVVLIHMVLQSIELSQARVRQRVLSGGHDVPDDKLIE